MLNILVVEDDKLLGQSVRDVLTQAEFQVFWAKDGKETFEILAQQKMDMVYLDIMLPGEMDGYRILQQIRHMPPPYPDIPIVMLSNFGQMSEIEKALGMGATDYIVKANVDLSELVELTKKKTAGIS